VFSLVLFLGFFFFFFPHPMSPADENLFCSSRPRWDFFPTAKTSSPALFKDVECGGPSTSLPQRSLNWLGQGLFKYVAFPSSAPLGLVQLNDFPPPFFSPSRVSVRRTGTPFDFSLASKKITLGPPAESCQP